MMRWLVHKLLSAYLYHNDRYLAGLIDLGWTGYIDDVGGLVWKDAKSR